MYCNVSPVAQRDRSPPTLRESGLCRQCALTGWFLHTPGIFHTMGGLEEDHLRSVIFWGVVGEAELGDSVSRIGSVARLRVLRWKARRGLLETFSSLGVTGEGPLPLTPACRGALHTP